MINSNTIKVGDTVTVRRIYTGTETTFTVTDVSQVTTKSGVTLHRFRGRDFVFYGPTPGAVSSWEILEVETPFVLPSGVGAVIGGAYDAYYVRVGVDRWVGVFSLVEFTDKVVRDNAVRYGHHVRSEGVNIP